MRNSGVLRGLADATGTFVNDDIVMRGIAAEQAAETDDGIVFSGFGKGTGGGGNFERTGYTDDVNVLLLCTGTEKRVTGALQQTFGNECIKT